MPTWVLLCLYCSSVYLSTISTHLLSVLPLLSTFCLLFYYFCSVCIMHCYVSISTVTSCVWRTALCVCLYLVLFLCAKCKVCAEHYFHVLLTMYMQCDLSCIALGCDVFHFVRGQGCWAQIHSGKSALISHFLGTPVNNISCFLSRVCIVQFELHQPVGAPAPSSLCHNGDQFPHVSCLTHNQPPAISHCQDKV